MTVLAATRTTGALALLRLGLRRDRVLAPVWMLCLVATAATSLTATVDLYPQVQDRVAAAESFNGTAALVAIYGPITDVSSLGQIALFKMVLLGGLLLAFLCALVVRRHTRVDEETGRAELVLSAIVGVDAPLASATAEALGLALLTGLLTAGALTAAGLDATGSLAFGLGWTGLGFVATGVAGVAAQLTSSARSAGGITAAVLGVSYVLRAVGDVQGRWLTWLSPFGWTSHVAAYGGNHWWVLLLHLGVTAGLLAAAAALRARRDLGAGLLADRPGLAHGRLGTFSGLLLRLSRTGLLAWVAALTALGLVLGGIVTSVDDMLTSDAARAMFERLGGTGAAESVFLAAELSFVAAMVSAWAITVATRLAAEETAGRAETLLATTLSRARVFSAAAALVLLGSLALLACCGLGLGVSYGLATGAVGEQVPRVVGAATAQAPAVWIVAALALAGWAAAARWGWVGWVILGGFLLLGQLGALLGLPSVVLNISPYAHAPKAPAAAVNWTTQGLLAGLTALVLAAAWGRYRRRDLG